MIQFRPSLHLADRPTARLAPPPDALEQALEISLLPAVDPLLASVMNPSLGGNSRVVSVTGRFTKEGDPTFERIIDFHKQFDPTSGEGITRGSISRLDMKAPPTQIYEVSQMLGTEISAIGRVSNDGLMDPPNARFSQRFIAPGMRIEGTVGHYHVRCDTNVKDGKPNDEGWIMADDGQNSTAVHFQRTIFSQYGGDMSFEGTFGGLREEGQARLGENGAVSIERKIGPYTITQEITRELSY